MRWSLNHALPAFPASVPDGDTHEVMSNFPFALQLIPSSAGLGLHLGRISSATAASVKETGFVKDRDYWVMVDVVMYRKGSYDGS